jgi:hypothetical protein
MPQGRIPNQTRRLQKGETGYSATAKRRVDASIPHGRVTRSTPTYSDRQVATAKTGQKREARTKALASGQARYSSAHARAAALYNRKAGEVRRDVRHVDSDVQFNPKDLRIIVKRKEVGWRRLSDEDRMALSDMFGRYGRDVMLAALGSDPDGE